MAATEVTRRYYLHTTGYVVSTYCALIGFQFLVNPLTALLLAFAIMIGGSIYLYVLTVQGREQLKKKMKYEATSAAWTEYLQVVEYLSKMGGNKDFVLKLRTVFWWRNSLFLYIIVVMIVLRTVPNYSIA